MKAAAKLKSQSSTQKTPDVAVLFRRKNLAEIQTKYSDGLRKWTEEKLGVRLPESYINLMKQRNGGELRLSSFAATKRGDPFTLGQIAGLDQEHKDSITSKTSLARDEWEIPKGLVAFDGDGHTWMCLDYRRCGPNGEPTVTCYETEFEGGFRVAKSFDELLNGLFFDAGEFIFALDDPDLHGDHLHQRLAELGCKGVYAQGATKSQKKKPPSIWSWPEFDSLQVNAHNKTPYHEKVYLQLSDNGPLDPWTLERPARHPLLRVSVSRHTQQQCVLRLANELNGAILIHQPYGRPKINGLPEPVPFIQRKPSREVVKPPKESHLELVAAVRAGDRAAAKLALRSGIDPGRRYLGAGTVTAIDHAVFVGETKMLSLLLAHTNKPVHPKNMNVATYRGHLGMVKLLVKLGLKPDEGHLLTAVTERHEPLVRYLLSLGIHPSPKVIRSAAGLVENVPFGKASDLHLPILRMLKRTGAVPPDSKTREIFESL